MKTKTYDLNLYVIDGHLKVLAHELELSSDGDIQSIGSNFHKIIDIPVTRGNARQWQNFLDFFGEDQMFDELDSWWTAPVVDISTPEYDYPAGTLNPMPGELQQALKTLPEYELVSYA